MSLKTSHQKENLHLFSKIICYVMFWSLFFLFRIGGILDWAILKMGLWHWLSILLGLCLFLIIFAILEILISYLDILLKDKSKKVCLLNKVGNFLGLFTFNLALFLLIEILIFYSNNRWWLYLIIIGNIYTLFTTIFFRQFIQLFYQVQKFPEGLLREEILSFIQSNGVEVGELFKVDIFGNSVAISGFGKKNLYFSTEVVSSCSVEETNALVAHELGHKVNFHMEKEMLLRIALTSGGCYLMYVSYGYVVELLGIHPNSIEGIPLLYLFWQFNSKLVDIMSLFFSRLMEKEADLYAAGIIDDVENLVLALSKDYQGNPSPSFLTYVLTSSHPKLEDRIKIIRARI